MSQAVCTEPSEWSNVFLLFFLFIHFIWYAKEHTSHLTCCHAAARWTHQPHSAIQFLSLASELWSCRLSVCVQQSIIVVIQYTMLLNTSDLQSRANSPLWLSERNSMRSHLLGSALLSSCTSHTDTQLNYRIGLRNYDILGDFFTQFSLDSSSHSFSIESFHLVSFCFEFLTENVICAVFASVWI